MINRIRIWWLKRKLFRQYHAIQATGVGDGGMHITAIIKGECLNRRIRAFNATLEKLRAIDPDAIGLKYIRQRRL